MMNNPFDYSPSEECNNAFEQLLLWLELPQHESLRAFLNEGKMLGVLIAEDSEGLHHTLYAFSGQLSEGGFDYPGFVEGVFDYLDPNGYFKRVEADISRQNQVIAEYISTVLQPLRKQCAQVQSEQSALLAERKEQYRLSKLERERIREAGVTPELKDELIRQSQFEKAELARLKRRLKAELAPLSDALAEAESYHNKLKEQRRRDSEELQRWLFDNFKVLNAYGENRSLTDIFAETAMKIPPSGAGECCAPKLLQAAYKRGLKPVSMAEYWYGKPKEGEVRVHGKHYPACRGKCLPVLSWMTEGLELYPTMAEVISPSSAVLVPEILFENEWFVVVNKPAGLLSVPGKGSGVSVQQWLETHYGVERQVRMAHRLDQDTSGLLVATFGDLPYKIMQTLFATRRVAKTYEAILDGDYREQGTAQEGCIILPLSPDWFDRPRQRVDYESGKESVTDYRFLGVEQRRSRIEFHPHTGRTHQLRVSAASVHGLGLPIVGDRLYSTPGSRLHLHARSLEFQFPIDNKTYRFESPTPF